MKFGVIDGQGGRIGKLIIEKIKEKYPNSEIIALGTNSAATSTMIKSGASKGATGENSIILNADRVDCILGPIAIVLANSMLGEVTPKIAEAIATSATYKILIPLDRCNVRIVGTGMDSVSRLVDLMIEDINTHFDL